MSSVKELFFNEVYNFLLYCNTSVATLHVTTVFLAFALS